MFPAGFEYHRPTTVSEAVGLISTLGDEARVLAGGHSLIPLMKLRLAAVEHLIDLQDLPELQGVRIEAPTPNWRTDAADTPEGRRRITIGAMTTQHALIADETLAAAAPIVREAALQIADPQVRYVGTLGGNIANGDPGNDMPGLMQCLDATYTLRGPNGVRQVSARNFYEAAYVTAREDDEILISASFLETVGGFAYEKQKRKIGDYATAACAALVVKKNGVCTEASIAMTNLSETPVYSADAGAALVGSACGTDDVARAVEAAAGAIAPNEDNRGPVDFKMHVARTIIRRAIERAASRA